MSNESEAEAAVMRQAMERAVRLIGCGRYQEARRLLSFHLARTNVGRTLLRAYERDRERSERCLRDHLASATEALMRDEAPSG